MEVEDLLKKVRKIEISTRRVVDDVMSGQYKSNFKGHGVQFSEHRVYMPGDDIRHIDWKVSARTREPLIKMFEEERELQVLLLVDVSRSEVFGSSERLKSEVVAELGGMLSFSATLTGDKVGVIFFAGEVEKTIPPRKGKNHVLRIIRDLLQFSPKSKGTRLSGALESASRVLKHSGVVFILSDFITQEDYEVPLKRLSKRHDVVALWVKDRRERKIPNVGTVLMHDPETGEDVYVNTGSFGFKRWLESHQKKSDAKARQLFKSARVDCLEIETQEDYEKAVVGFFRHRARRSR